MLELQAQIDSTQQGQTLKLGPGEHRGPIVIKRPITIEGQGAATIWAPEGPVVSIRTNGVQMSKLNLEITSKESLTGEQACALVVQPGVQLQLNDVSVSGNIQGLDREEGAWQYPRNLDLKTMKPGEIHHFKTKVEVPVPCQVQSRIDVLSVHPKEIRTAGQVEIVLDVAALPPGAKLRGDICLQTSRVVRLIKVSGQAAKDRPAASTAPIIVDGLPPPPQPPPSPLTSPLKSTPLTSTSLRTNVTVDKMGGGEYRTLQEAIQNATPGTRINVKPGLYKEALIINKSLEIVGDGPRSEIRIECNEGNCLRIETDYAKFRGLTLRAVGRGSKERFAVAITHGDIEMEECDISSDSLACVGIFGGSARPVLRYCKIHDGKSAGVIFYDRAQGQLESCEIIGNAQAGVEIFDGADPVLRKCTISKGKQVGVLVRDSGKGTFEGCDIFANALAGVEITQKAAPTLRDCKIHDGEYIGVRVCDQGEGTFEDCQIFSNNGCGVSIRTAGNPTLRKCQIARSKHNGVLFCSKARGTLEGCDITESGYANVHIRRTSNPVLRGCKIHAGQDTGVDISDKSRPVLANCTISANARCGVDIRAESVPTLQHCKIFENGQAGILVHDRAEGNIEGCNIEMNEWAGVAIVTAGNPSLTRCSLRAGKHAGLVVGSEGKGTAEECNIVENALGVVIAMGGNPVIRKCRIQRNNGIGLWAFAQPAGLVEECELGGNTGGDKDVDGGKLRLRRNKSNA